MELRELNPYQCVGFSLELLAMSPYHRQFIAAQYFWTEINPALSLRQVKFYVTENGHPCAMVTWAWLSEKVEREILDSGRVIEFNEWKSGDRLFFNDFIAPYGFVKEVIKDLRTTVFPHQLASSLRRQQDRKIRKVNRWSGVQKKYKNIESNTRLLRNKRSHLMADGFFYSTNQGDASNG